MQKFEASPTSTKGDGGELAAFAKRLRQAKREYFADNPTTLAAITPFDIVAYDMEKAADSSPPADYTDIVGLRDLAEKIHKEAVNYEGEQEFIVIKHVDFDLLMMRLTPKATSATATSGEGQ